MQGLTFEEYRASGKNGHYRPDLDRFFTDDMVQPEALAIVEPVLEPATEELPDESE